MIFFQGESQGATIGGSPSGGPIQISDLDLSHGSFHGFFHRIFPSFHRFPIRKCPKSRSRPRAPMQPSSIRGHSLVLQWFDVKVTVKNTDLSEFDGDFYALNILNGNFMVFFKDVIGINWNFMG